jgi:CRISPR-associated protein Csd2
MSNFEKKVDFAAIISVSRANPNGDPLNGNRPRVSYDGLGEISDVCIKRKIRNRMQDMGQNVFVKSSDKNDDKYNSLSERARNTIISAKTNEEYAAEACKTWLDVRSFGQVFAFKSKDGNGISVGVRGPVSVHQAISVSPVEVDSMQITKSVNSETSEKGGKSSDTMGTKHMINFGLYIIKGSINVQLAEKTGFSQEDAEIIKECLRTLFENDTSSARPDGSMEICKLYWWQHNCKDGQYSSAKVHRSLKVQLKPEVELPHSVEDYIITLEELPGLKPEVIDGI